MFASNTSTSNLFAPYTFADAQRLLVKPFERLNFLLGFVLVTGFAQLAMVLLLSRPAFESLLAYHPIQSGIVTGLMGGLWVGALQWLVLRRYIPNWKWIAVSGSSAAFLRLMGALLDTWIASRLGRANDFFAPTPVSLPSLGDYLVLGAIGIGVIAAIFSYGYLKWWVIRPYVVRVRWWMFTGFIAILAVAPVFLLRFVHPLMLNLNMDGFSLILFPVVEAIAFCLLKRRSVNDHLEEQSMPQSPLVSAPDIVSYWTVRRLHKTLNMRISRIWKTDLDASSGALCYLVGVDHQGTPLIYDPIDPVSREKVAQTPLPQLLNKTNASATGSDDMTHATLEIQSSMPLAKFQVEFKPPGVLHVKSWRGIPILWIAVGFYVLSLILNPLYAALVRSFWVV